MEWLVVGFSGVSCGGKTTMANMLFNYLSDPQNQYSLNQAYRINSVKVINQDNYFLPKDHPNHTWIAKLNHINWDIISALDMDQMCLDINACFGQNFHLYEKSEDDENLPTVDEINILIIEGFLLFNHTAIRNLCQIKFHVHLPYEICYARRSVRTYDPPDVPGYFETCVWPMYQKYFKDYVDRDDVLMINGASDREKCFRYALECIKRAF